MDTPKLAKVSLHMQGVSEMVVSLSIVPSLTPTTLVLLQYCCEAEAHVGSKCSYALYTDRIITQPSNGWLQ